MNNGHKVVAWFLGITYVFPFVGNLVFHANLRSTYKIYPATAHSVLAIVAVYGVFLLLTPTRVRFLPAISTKPFRPVLGGIARMYARFRFVPGFVALPLSVRMLLGGMNNYRYADVGLTSALNPAEFTILIVTVVLNQWITIDLFYCMFAESRPTVEKSWKRYAENMLFAAILLLTANGIATVFQALVAITYALRPRFVNSVLFAAPNARRSIGDGVRMLGTVSVLALIFTTALYVGSIIKSSSSSDVVTLLESDPQEVVGLTGTNESLIARMTYYLVERLSIHYYSYEFTSAASREELANGKTTVLEFPLQTLLYRLDYLTGGSVGIRRPTIASIMQLNYQLLTAGRISDREGSSPGLLAAFNYVFPLPFSVVLAALYLCWFARLSSRLLSRHNRMLSIVGVVLFLQFTQPLLASPFDFLMIFDDGVVYAVALILLSLNEPYEVGEKRARQRVPIGTTMAPRRLVIGELL